MRWALAAALLALASCGGGEKRPQLTVAAATSLRVALTEYAETFEPAEVRLSFAGSDAIAARIRAGVEPDVFVSSDLRLLEGLGDEAVTVATNELVLAVAAERPSVRAFADLTRRGVTIAMGTPSVPVGAYADDALAQLPAQQRRRIMANVRTREPDVAGVIGKVTSGAVDAGFVYTTDVRAAHGSAIEIALPETIQPRIEYGAVALGRGAAARRFVDGLRRARALRDAGFGVP